MHGRSLKCFKTEKIIGKMVVQNKNQKILLMSACLYSISSFKKGFNSVNTAKNKLCSNLRQESSNNLMFTNLHVRSLKDFNFEKIISRWLFKGNIQMYCYVYALKCSLRLEDLSIFMNISRKK